MSSEIVLGLVVGGAAIGVGYLIFRSQKAKQETKPPGAKEACEAAAKELGVPTSVCEIGVPLVEDLVDWVDSWGDFGREYRAKDEENKKLNGAIKTPLVQAVKSCLDSSYSLNANTGQLISSMWGTALEFENGCTPFAGSPGWSKCAPGTNNMFYGKVKTHFGSKSPPEPFTGRTDVDLEGQSSDVGGGYRYFGDGRINTDPTTGQFAPQGANGKCAPLFPIPIPTGHRGFFVAGKPRTCPEGQVPDVKRASGCIPIPTPQSGPVVDDNGQITVGTTKGNTPRSSTTVNCVDPYILDTLPDGTKYCRRKRAGEP
jgi:hypothetical protein